MISWSEGLWTPSGELVWKITEQKALCWDEVLCLKSQQLGWANIQNEDCLLMEFHQKKKWEGPWGIMAHPQCNSEWSKRGFYRQSPRFLIDSFNKYLVCILHVLTHMPDSGKRAESKNLMPCLQWILIFIDIQVNTIIFDSENCKEGNQQIMQPSNVESSIPF